MRMDFIRVGNEKEEDALLINVEEIAAVTSLFGDPSWLRYSIVLKNGKEYDLYEERSADSKYMPRKLFLMKLKKYANINS